MSDLINQLGIDWRLLLSQAVNFLLLLYILRRFAYKPILKILKDRHDKIETGLVKAKEADEKLQHAAVMVKDKMKVAEADAMALMRKTEEDAKRVEAKMMEEAKIKEAALVLQAEKIIEGKAETAKLEMRKNAVSLVKAAIAKTVELSPQKIDDALIEKAVKAIK